MPPATQPSQNGTTRTLCAGCLFAPGEHHTAAGRAAGVSQFDRSWSVTSSNEIRAESAARRPVRADEPSPPPRPNWTAVSRCRVPLSRGSQEK